ncbi:MAG: acyl-CoA dehydrogenase family protein [Jiangellales bacterium]
MTETALPTTGHIGGGGLDLDTLDLMLEALTDFVAAGMDDDRMLQLDHDDVCPEDLVRAMQSDELGVQLVFLPEEYGGMGGGAFDIYRVCERMGRIDIGLATSVLATFLGSDPILVGATEEQRAHWMGRIAEEGILFAYGATEPEAGSDLGSLTTTAVAKRDDDGTITHYVINGRKQWISNGGIADATTILALTDGGPTWFVVENKSTPGFEAAPHEDKHGIRLSNTCALFLDDVEVPVGNLVGGVEGQGLVQAQQVFGYTRLMVAAFGLGGGWEALDRAITYSVNRIQGGAPLSQKQGLTHKLIIPHLVRLEAARSYIEETATRIDNGEGENGALNTEGAIAKYLATEWGNSAAEASIQVHGGYGYTRPYIVEKIKRDVRITCIYEGTSEIMEMTIGRDRWQHHLKTKGDYYHVQAAELRHLHAAHPTIGADVAALATDALAGVFAAAQTGRLTRNQHILFRLGELAAMVEAAGSLCRRAAAKADETISPKADKRFSAQTMATVSRVYARETALKVADDGVRWVAGGAAVAGVDGAELARTLAATLNIDEIRAAQAGLIADMDAISAAIYDNA